MSERGKGGNETIGRVPFLVACLLFLVSSCVVCTFGFTKNFDGCHCIYSSFVLEELDSKYSSISQTYLTTE
jgi:hypothetical protein